MRSAGLLPVMPGGAQRAARMALMERGRNDELAEVVLQDVALSFELMRSVKRALDPKNILNPGKIFAL